MASKNQFTAASAQMWSSCDNWAQSGVLLLEQRRESKSTLIKRKKETDITTKCRLLVCVPDKRNAPKLPGGFRRCPLVNLGVCVCVFACVHGCDAQMVPCVRC